MFTIPFTESKGYRPKVAIPDNTNSDTPVEFDLMMADGPNQARVKSLIQATTGLTLSLESWTPAVQANVVSALLRSSELFIGTIDAIRNLSAPARLCRLVALKVDEKAKDDEPIPIDTGVKFARVATYMPLLALELAFEISTLTHKAQVDPRFFASPSGSAPSAANQSGAAPAAPTPPAASATAESPTQTDASPITT